MSFGASLLDKQGDIEEYGQSGSESVSRLSDYLSKRAALSEAYARGLQKLHRQFSPPSPHEIGLEELLGGTEQVSRAHLKFVEGVTGALRDAMTGTAREHDKSRRAILADIRNLRAEWKKTLTGYEKTRKARDAAVRAAEDARVTFEKANNDMHVTKAYVEKTREDYAQKARKTLLCREEYIQIATTIRAQQARHYDVDLPALFDRLQRVEEARLEGVKSHLIEFGRQLAGTLQDELEQAREMTAKWEGLNAAAVVRRFIEASASKRPFEYPETISIDEGESPSLNRSDTRLSRPASMHSLTTGDGGQSRLERVEKELSVLEKQRDGVRVLHDMYTKQPDLADERARKETAREFAEITANFEALALERDQLKARLAKAVTDVGSARSASIQDTAASPVLWDDSDDDDDANGNGHRGSGGAPRNVAASGATSGAKLLPLFRARALYDYEGNGANGELSIRKGQVLDIYADGDDWWHAGDASGRSGYVPYNYVQRI